MDMITSALDEAYMLYGWIAENTNNLSIPNNISVKTSATILQQSIDVGDAILILLKRNLPGPALSLARTHYETYVCGIWLLNIATESEINKYHSGIVPKLENLIKMVCNYDPVTYKWIKKNKDNNLKSFHGLAHSGVEHSERRITSDGDISPNYKEEEILGLIKHCTTIQVFIAFQFFIIINDPVKINILEEKISKLCIICSLTKSSRGTP